MSVSPEEVRGIAVLARLELGQDEIGTMADQLSSILGHMEALGRVDVSEATPMDGGIAASAPLRPDTLGFDPLSRPPDEIAPAWRDHFFVVPRLAALDADALSEPGSGG